MITFAKLFATPENQPRHRRKYRDAIIRQSQTSIQPPRIGEFWEGQGGIYAGVMRGESGLLDYHLIVPTDVTASIKNIMWAENDNFQLGVLSEVDGLANTLVLCASTSHHPAAQWAQTLAIEGHHDFYLPARYELLLVHINLSKILRLHNCHWSSTLDAGNPGCAWAQDFNYGDQYTNHMSSKYQARAVRRVLIAP
jgi:hypothetical protein